MKQYCLFCMIAQENISTIKVYEDTDFIAFHDIKPLAPVHLLLITRRHITSIQEVTNQDVDWLGRMMILIPQLAIKNGCVPGNQGGFRLLNNAGKHGGQEIPHLHFHILGGPRPWNKIVDF